MTVPPTMVASGGEEETIRAVLNGDVDRYAQLVDRYQDAAIRLAFSFLGNWADAEDATQEAFVSAYRSLGRFGRRARFSTWLYRIVVNKCTDCFRRKSRQPLVACGVDPEQPSADGSGLFVDVEDPSGDPRDHACAQELARRLAFAIGSLAPKQRTVFTLHHLNGLSLDEVAAILRCRLGTVKSHLFRATRQLQATLGPWLQQEGLR